MRGASRLLVLLLYLIFGFYFLIFPFGIFELTESLSNLEPWIIFIGGFLILFGGINYFRAGRYRY